LKALEKYFFYKLQKNVQRYIKKINFAR